MKRVIQIVILVFLAGVVSAQKPLFKFGEEIGFDKITSGQKVKGEPVQWIQVNTKDSTWKLQGKELIWYGWPIGVIRSEKQ